MKTRASLVLATLLSSASSHAFFAPVPVIDGANAAKAAQALRDAEEMLTMHRRMLGTVFAIKRVVDGGALGLLSVVSLPGGATTHAIVRGAITGEVPYHALASGLQSHLPIPQGAQPLVDLGVDAVASGDPRAVVERAGRRYARDFSLDAASGWATSVGADQWAVRSALGDVLAGHDPADVARGRIEGAARGRFDRALGALSRHGAGPETLAEMTREVAAGRSPGNVVQRKVAGARHQLTRAVADAVAGQGPDELSATMRALGGGVAARMDGQHLDPDTLARAAHRDADGALAERLDPTWLTHVRLLTRSAPARAHAGAMAGRIHPSFARVVDRPGPGTALAALEDAGAIPAETLHWMGTARAAEDELARIQGADGAHRALAMAELGTRAPAHLRLAGTQGGQDFGENAQALLAQLRAARDLGLFDGSTERVRDEVLARATDPDVARNMLGPAGEDLIEAYELGQTLRTLDAKTELMRWVSDGYDPDRRWRRNHEHLTRLTEGFKTPLAQQQVHVDERALLRPYATALTTALAPGKNARARDRCATRDGCRWNGAQAATYPRVEASATERAARQQDLLARAVAEGHATARAGEETTPTVARPEEVERRDVAKQRALHAVAWAETGCAAPAPDARYPARDGVPPIGSGDAASPADALYVPTQESARPESVKTTERVRAALARDTAREAFALGASWTDTHLRRARVATTLRERFHACDELLCELRQLADVERARFDAAESAVDLTLARLALAMAETVRGHEPVRP